VREWRCEERGEAGGVGSGPGWPGRVGRAEGKAAGLGGVGRSSLGVPRGGLAAAPRSGVSGAGCREERQ